jgi:hypothetical protein
MTETIIAPPTQQEKPVSVLGKIAANMEAAEVKQKEAQKLSDEAAPLKTVVAEEKKEPVAENPKAEPKAEEKVELKVVPKEEPIKINEDNKEYLEWLNGEEKPVIETKIENKQEEKPKEDDAVTTYKKKAEAYDRVLSNPVAKTVVDALEAGVPFDEITKNINGINYDKMSEEDIYKIQLNKLGITDQAELEEELALFNEKRKVEKLSIINPIKAELKKEQDEKLKTFTNPYKAQSDKHTNMITKGQEQLSEKIKNMTGKKYLGLLLIEPEMAKKIQDDVTEHAFYNSDKSGFDIERSVRVAVVDRYLKPLLKASNEMYKSIGYDEALSQRQRPSRNDTVNATAPLSEENIGDLIKKRAAQGAKERGWIAPSK